MHDINHHLQLFSKTNIPPCEQANTLMLELKFIRFPLRQSYQQKLDVEYYMPSNSLACFNFTRYSQDQDFY